MTVQWHILCSISMILLLLIQIGLLIEESDMMDSVVLVDKNDIPIGEMEKYKAHKLGMLHRAFSIFIVNSEGQLLLQQRAWSKYHSGGLWSNTCCSHPRPGEALEHAAQRRLIEEMGFSCPLIKQFNFIYKTQLDNQLTEHEYDHVFFGKHDSDPVPDPEEAAAWKWIHFSEISTDLKTSPDAYTYWFGLIWPKAQRNLNKFIDAVI